MLLDTGTSLFENLLAGKDTIKTGYGRIRLGFLMLPHPLINFEIQRYYQNVRRCNDVYSRNYLPKMKERRT